MKSRKKRWAAKARREELRGTIDIGYCSQCDEFQAMRDAKPRLDGWGYDGRCIVCSSKVKQGWYLRDEVVDAWARRRGRAVADV